MRSRPLKNLVGISDVLGSRGFRFPDDQVYRARFSDRAHILETKLCHQAQFVFALHFTTAYHKLQK